MIHTITKQADSLKTAREVHKEKVDAGKKKKGKKAASEESTTNHSLSMRVINNMVGYLIVTQLFNHYDHFVHFT